MPEMFGTHHSKVSIPFSFSKKLPLTQVLQMLVLIRQDSTAQVIIHTANMIPFDWMNMTQGLWKSPLLPLLPNDSLSSQPNVIGSGTRFKIDFINYLRAYDDKRVICKPLIEQLTKYDFSEVRAALIASVPGKQGIDDDDVETKWGWAGLNEVLKSVPARGNEPEIAVQISSIATLGQTNKWLDQTLFRALRLHKGGAAPKSKFRIIFPTADEVRRSLNGYDSGSAIHTKIQTAAQVKQLHYLKPLLCHWAGDGAQHSASSSIPISDAGRKRAAPHIKTYIRFADKERSCIDWMLVTSANLSKQAWGETTNSAGEVRICSYEIGVMVWPGLFGENAIMVPTFKSDTPPTGTDEGVVIGARMPYDLPVVPYAKGDKPWCATSSYTEPDWKGETYIL
jgi:tyrosyl-DNA phosphodiesterase-1